MADASTLFEDVVDSATSSQLEEEQELRFVSSLSSEETTQETTVEAEGIAQTRRVWTPFDLYPKYYYPKR